MLIFNIFFPVITGSNHGVGECDHIIKRTNDCQRLHPRCHLDQASFSPPPCHLDQALARGEISLSRATPCKLRCLDYARHDRAVGGRFFINEMWQEYYDKMSDARVDITRLMMQEHTKIYPNCDAGCIPFLAHPAGFSFFLILGKLFCNKSFVIMVFYLEPFVTGIAHFCIRCQMTLT